MALVTREQFEQSKHMQTTDVEVPEFGGTMRVKSMTARERSELEKQFLGKNEAMSDPGGFRVALLSLTIADEAGELMFTKDDRDLLLSKDAGGIERLFEAACKLNGFSKADVDDLEKN